MKGNSSGVSPVISVILMVAITVILAGVVVIFSLSITDENTNGGEKYLFTVKLSGDGDVINITLISGDVLDTSGMRVVVEDQDIEETPAIVMYAGDDLQLNSPIDLVTGQSYEIKIVVNNQVYYSNTLNAGR